MGQTQTQKPDEAPQSSFLPNALYATVLRPSVVVCLYECIVAKGSVLEQKLLLTAYRKSYMRNRMVPK